MSSRVTHMLPYLKVVGNFCMIDPPFFFTFLDLYGSLFYAQVTLFHPKKIRLSLSHLVLEKIGLIAGMFHQNLSFDSFEAFCTNFLLDFPSSWSPFPLFLDIFNPSLWHNLKSDCVHSFMWLTPLPYWTFGEVPPPPGVSIIRYNQIIKYFTWCF